VVLGEDMKEKVLGYGVAGDRVVVIPNWADLRELAVDPGEILSLREEWGLAGKKVVMYSGNLGRAHTFGEMLDAARELRGRPDIVFLFVGGGNQWEAVRGQAESEGLENVRFRPYTERGRLGASLGAGDVHLITQRSGTEGLLVPCKLYGILAAGKPVIFVGPRGGEVARTLARCGAGTTISPGDGAGLAGAIASCLDDPSAVEKGASGRAWMRSEGDRPHRTGQYERLFVDVARVRS
jgi:glycosyltransferase involved in cell wall biosynthesis